MRSGGRAVKVINPTDVEWATWNRRYNIGELPDPSPYNLNELANHFPITVDRPPRVSVKKIALGFLRTSHPRGPLMVAWDERTALRACLNNPGDALASGVIWLTDRWPLMNPVERQLYRHHLSRARLLWVLSEAQVEPLKSIVGNRPRIEVLRFGIDTDFFPATAASNEPMVLSLGNDRDRDLPTLYAALSEAMSEIPELNALVQTSDPSKAPRNVEVVPTLTHREIRSLYQRATLVAIATRPNLHFSGMTTALEAGSTARPIVITDTPGASTYVVDQTTGILVTPGDSGAIAREIIRLARDRDVAAQMGSRASVHVRERHSSKEMIARLAIMLEQVR